jgi:hypothetical protein
MTNFPFIHYSNPRFQNGKEEIIYGADESSNILKSLNWVYSDRLFEYTYKRRKEPGQSDLDYWENILKIVQGREVEIKCVIGGCNRSNGEGYYILGYKDKENKE